jgi:hypothetical protein
MPNALASALITGGVASIGVGVYYGEVSNGELGLYMFALLIALNCQNWRKDKKEDEK